MCFATVMPLMLTFWSEGIGFSAIDFPTGQIGFAAGIARADD